MDMLDKIHSVQLEIMDEIHRICEANGITYYMIGGTLLGAVRHKGFIPWDVDIDISMPRDDYERFKTVCATELSPAYSYLDMDSSRSFRIPHALVRKNGTDLPVIYDAVNHQKENHGVYIDIFPLDAVPADEGKQKKQAKKLLRLRKWKDRRVFYCYSFKPWKRLVHYAISTALIWLPVSVLNRMEQKEMQRYRYNHGDCVCSMASKYAYSKQAMPRSVYGTPIKMEFAGRQYFAPENPLDYLTRVYGDYQKLPSPEQQAASLAVFRTESAVIF